MPPFIGISPKLDNYSELFAEIGAWDFFASVFCPGVGADMIRMQELIFGSSLFVVL